jgi:hypothetical protein
MYSHEPPHYFDWSLEFLSIHDPKPEGAPHTGSFLACILIGDWLFFGIHDDQTRNTSFASVHGHLSTAHFGNEP